MTIKQIIDEALDIKTMNQQIQQLNQGIQNLNQKVSQNPDINKVYGNDLANIGNMSKGLNSSFQALVQQQLAEKEAEKKKQMNNTVLKNTATTASNTAQPSQPQANGFPAAQLHANGSV